MASVAIKEAIVPTPSGMPTSDPMPPATPSAMVDAVVVASNSSSGTGKQKSKIPDSSVDSIDSALLSALRDHRERLGLLKLEQMFLDFVNKSDCLYWDIGGPMNSWIRNSKGEWVGNNNNNDGGPIRPQTTFQRCILHRLGDRFQITREPQDDGLIRIFKTPQTDVPSRLLLNVPSSEYQLSHSSSSHSLEQQMDQQLSLQDSSSSDPNTVSQSQASSLAVANTNPLLQGNGGKPRKMKIMKRSSNSNVSTGSTKNKSKSSNGASSVSDKERKYAEARARIFQQSQEEAMAETLPISTQDDAAAASISNSMSTSAPASMASSLTASSAEYVPSFSSAAPSMTPSMTSTSSNSSSNPSAAAAAQDSSSNKPSKATWRNRQSEMNDPDFQRQRHRRPAAPPASAPTPIGYGYVQPIPTSTMVAAAAANTSYYPPATSVAGVTPYTAAASASAGRGGYHYQQPLQQGGANNYYGGIQAYAPQHQHQQPIIYPSAAVYHHTPDYRRSHSASEAAPSIHSSEEFPSLGGR